MIIFPSSARQLLTGLILYAVAEPDLTLSIRRGKPGYRAQVPVR
jgi:hypothetical protein